ncbi:MAG: hypothetical protein BGO26_18940 [Actinobacteria bacterium 69-20]|jgi:hypothetical protein|nr:hypothetical protein [Actinomycetota bacterium]OJV24636.1 MAG: hypothetical protein BGO26_18940 [Actinobacteria bacterium 69-20]
MKTTIDIPTPLLERTREYAREQDRTVKSLVEEALIKLLEEHATRPKRVLRDASVPGWLTPEYAGKTVTEMIHEDYEERMDRIVHAADWMLESNDRG